MNGLEGFAALARPKQICAGCGKEVIYAQRDDGSGVEVPTPESTAREYYGALVCFGCVPK